jgi:lipopolysaccharide export system permease protein
MKFIASIMDRYLYRRFFPVFAIMAGFFVLVLVMVDLFTNLARYLNFSVPLGKIMLVSWYYLPTCISYAVPMGLLFAVAYTIGDLLAHNELTAIFASGIPFYRFTLPLVFLGVLLSGASFFFQDACVVPTAREKTRLQNTLLHQQVTASNSNLVIKAQGGRLIYAVDYYDASRKILNGLSIISLDTQGNFVSLVRASQANWTPKKGKTAGHWTLNNAVCYQWPVGAGTTDDLASSASYLTVTKLDPANAVSYTESPETFERSSANVDELAVKDARGLISDLKASGLPYAAAETKYYHRFSWAFAPFIVLLLSIPLGGRFRKNILLWSLFLSLVVVVGFYVMDMVTTMLAQISYLPPIVGAWTPIAFFGLAGGCLIWTAKT